MSDVSKWLEALGLGEYADVFAENAVDFRALPALTEDDLKELGVKLGHRRVLQGAIADLAAGPAMPAAEPPSGATSPPPPTDAAERRQLTIMFCDLAGSTELSQRLDAEDLREVNRAYQDACTRAIERYEGYVARYMGDGVLAYFGYPRAHEDDAERAVHAGLGVVEVVAALDAGVVESAGLALAVRVGIATGEVVVGDLIGEGASQESAVVGETPNLAARLQALAAPHSVVISPGTYALAAGSFDYADLGHHALKGIAAAVHARRVIAPSRAESRFEAARRAELTPLVGREQEVDLLLERWERAKEGDGQVVLLSGEAGIGKSRIVEALQERTAPDDPARLRYQCSPYHMSSALHPVIVQLERAARFEAGDDDARKLDKLESLLAAGTREVEAAAALIAPLLSVATTGRYAPLGLPPDRLKERTLEALVAQLEGLGRQRPVLFVFEDAHWADPTSLELLELTVSGIQHLQALVVITFRPDFSPPWTGYTHVTSLALNRLSRSLAAAMAGMVTGGKVLPDEVLEQIIEKTDGVPLFVEELTKTLLESGLLVEEADRYVLAGSLSGMAIPATLHDSLMARLDRLGAVKEVAQTAAAIGREFDYDLLAQVSSLGFDRLRDALAQLIDAELVFRHGRSQEGRYFFKHALVQDAAYGSLLRSHRRALHARIAEALVSRFAERAERAPELVAQHLSEAALPARAAPYWRDAGMTSSSHSAYAEAVSQFTRGLEVIGVAGEDAAQVRVALDMQIGLADSLAWSRGFGAPEVEAAYSRARELCRRVGDVPELFGILWGLWHFFDVRGDLDRALELAHELRRLAAAGGGGDRRSQAHRALGETWLWRGEIAPAREETDRGIAVYEHGPDSRIPGGEDAAVANRVMNAVALWCLGHPDQALVRVSETLELCEVTRSDPDRCMSWVFLATVHLLRREPGSARPWSDRLLDFATERGMSFFEAFARTYGGATMVMLGAHEEGALEMERGLEAHEGTGGRTLRAFFLSLLADARLETGQAREALAALERAFDSVEQCGDDWWLGEMHRLRGESLRLLDNAVGARGSFDRAIEIARSQQARSLELRACTSLARLCRDEGRRREATDLLAPVHDWFSEGFETLDLVAARALLDELS